MALLCAFCARSAPFFFGSSIFAGRNPRSAKTGPEFHRIGGARGPAAESHYFNGLLARPNPELRDLKRKITRWAAYHRASLREADPEVPEASSFKRNA